MEQEGGQDLGDQHLQEKEAGTEGKGGGTAPQWNLSKVLSGVSQTPPSAGGFLLPLPLLSLWSLSLQGLPSENLHYTSVVFDSRSQDSKTDRIPSQKPQTQEPVYSMVKKT